MAIPNASAKRVMKEIKFGYESKEFDFISDPDGKYGEENACYIRFTVRAGTYMGQTHILKIKFTYGQNQAYSFPKDPPNILFLTPILHTNIATGGSICLDVIKSDKWSPMYGIETIFTSILALLEDPNTSSPYNAEAAKLYTANLKTPEIYKKICHEYYISKLKKGDIAHDLIHSSDFQTNNAF